VVPEPRIRYVKTPDSCEIAFATIGKGPPLVLLLPNSHLTLTWAVPSLREFFQRLAQSLTLINLDCRGSGLSQRDGIETSDLTFELDISAVLDILGVSHASLFGLGIAAPIALSYAASCPERVDRLVLMEASRGNSRVNEAIKNLGSVTYSLVAAARAAYVVGLSDPQNAEAYSALQRESRDPATALQFDLWLGAFNVAEICRRIEAPALFIHAVDDKIFPLEQARDMVANMPAASLRVFPGDSGFTLRRDEDVIREILSFLDDSGADQPLVAANSKLSVRENQVLQLIASGRTNKQIADAIGVSVSTVSHHVTNILHKTDSTNRTEAAGYAHRMALLDQADIANSC
jgi:pimeloyl-ACP methyl ester carboxylesterase/DNA-binding CsgD family transcriptional regulator